MIKKFEVLTPSRGEGGQHIFEGVIVIDNHPYVVLRERALTNNNAWFDKVRIEPFVEEKKDGV